MSNAVGLEKCSLLKYLMTCFLVCIATHVFQVIITLFVHLFIFSELDVNSWLHEHGNCVTFFLTITVSHYLLY